MSAPDVVYVVRPGERNEELRYSLRSLRNLPHGRVWIAGHRPSWVVGIGHIGVVQSGTAYENSTANLLAACQHPEVSEEFLLFNDDFFVLEPIEEIPVLHRGRVAERAVDYEREFGRSRYLEGMEATASLLADLGHPDPLSYEVHAPMLLDKAGMAEAIRLPIRHEDPIKALHKRTLYGNLRSLGGELAPEFKVRSAARALELRRSWPFLSTEDESFALGEVGALVRRALPEPSPYEAPRDQEVSRMGDVRIISPEGKRLTVTEKVYRNVLSHQGYQLLSDVQAVVEPTPEPTAEPAVTVAEHTETVAEGSGTDTEDIAQGHDVDLGALSKAELLSMAEAQGLEVSRSDSKTTILEALTADPELEELLEAQGGDAEPDTADEGLSGVGGA